MSVSMLCCLPAIMNEFPNAFGRCRYVINYDAPHTAEAYVHRAGRTARQVQTLFLTFLSCAPVLYLILGPPWPMHHFRRHASAGSASRSARRRNQRGSLMYLRLYSCVYACLFLYAFCIIFTFAVPPKAHFVKRIDEFFREHGQPSFERRKVSLAPLLTNLP